jgi:hypothetical protein
MLPSISGPQGKWLRYHPLFADFLRERMLQVRHEAIIDSVNRLLAFF